MYAAGFAEGWVSAERIFDYYNNTLIYFKTIMRADLGKPLAWLQEQDQWARQQASAWLWFWRQSSAALVDSAVAFLCSKGRG